jgi:hypothetical protein
VSPQGAKRRPGRGRAKRSSLSSVYRPRQADFLRGPQGEKQIPFGNDNKKNKAKATAKTLQQQIPFGYDNKEGN